MNKYNQLREEIILAVPDIVELKFGCVIMFKEKEYLIYRSFRVEGDDYLCCVNNGEEKLILVKGNNLKIIGRDITLEDCLIAIKKEIEKDNIGHSDGYGYIMDLCYREQPNSWKPNIPLQDQSDECKELLFNLIVKR